MKSKTTAGFLALFLGGLGIHHFYLNRPWLGITYLLFCWTFIPAIVALIEAILYFSETQNAFDNKHNRKYLQVQNAKEEREKIIALGALHSLFQSGQITEAEYNRKRDALK